MLAIAGPLMLITSDRVSPSPWYYLYTRSDLQILALKFRLLLEMTILGLPTKHSASTQVSDADCPIELPSNAA